MQLVKLISYSKPAPGIFNMFDPVDKQVVANDDLQALVAFCARVSNPTNQMNLESASKLIAYLVKNKHWSPFEMVNVCLEINTTRDIGRQILRHRSFSFQEFSQRYADPTSMKFVYREARLQDKKNRQNSFETEDVDLKYEWQSQQCNVMEAAAEAYKWAIENGIAKEQARVVLPEGLTTSVMYMNGTLRSWMHYCDIRTEHGTQKEHREIAKACAIAIAPIFTDIINFSH